MFQVLGLNMLDGLTNMLPLASFLGVLMGLGRMYRESEMHVLSSSGMGPVACCADDALGVCWSRSLVGAGVAVAGAVGGRARADNLVAAANRSVIAAGLDAGRFTELPGKGGIIFVDTLSRDGSKLGNTFLATERINQGWHPHDESGHRQARPALSGERRQRSASSPSAPAGSTTFRWAPTTGARCSTTATTVRCPACSPTMTKIRSSPGYMTPDAIHRSRCARGARLAHDSPPMTLAIAAGVAAVAAESARAALWTPAAGDLTSIFITCCWRCVAPDRQGSLASSGAHVDLHLRGARAGCLDVPWKQYAAQTAQGR
jgi:hypothetical protein